jgi:hypothetical protein
MDECVKSMTEVYQSYDGNRVYFESPINDETPNESNNNSLQTPSISVNDDPDKSLYDDFKLDEKVHFTNESINESTMNTLTSFDEKLKLDLKQEIKLVFVLFKSRRSLS